MPNYHIPRAVLAGLALALAVPGHAATVAYWRFEDTPGFLNDSSGNNHTLTNNSSITQVATGFSNPVPKTGASNANAASFSGSNYLTTTNESVGIFGVATLSAGVNYYAAMAVDMTDAGSAAITVYLKDLTTSDLQVFNFAKSGVVSGPTSDSTVFDAAAPFTIGATAQGGAQWVGAIDEVRLSNVKLAEADLLISPPPLLPLADWQLEDSPGFLADSAPASIDLTIAQPTVSQADASHFLGKSASFSAGGFLTAGDMAAWNASSMTAEVLFRAADVAGDTQVLVGRWDAADDRMSWALGIDSGKIRLLQSSDGITATIHDALTVAAGRDYHLALAVNGSDGMVYLNRRS